jgi:hypothetical protein
LGRRILTFIRGFGIFSKESKILPKGYSPEKEKKPTLKVPPKNRKLHNTNTYTLNTLLFLLNMLFCMVCIF